MVLAYASGIGYVLSASLHVILLFRVANPPNLLVFATFGGLFVVLTLYPFAVGIKIKFSRIMFGAWVSSSDCPSWLRAAYYLDLMYVVVLFVIWGLKASGVIAFGPGNALLPGVAMLFYMDVFLACYVLNSTVSE